MSDSRTETATIGGGCFWCLEAVYQELEGVHRVESGYAGGHVEHPTYPEVCRGNTGHAEVVQLDFDPGVTSYREILEVFFSIHDPTTPDRQGVDVGPQYRSIILVHDEEQRRLAEAIIGELEKEGIGPVVTEVERFEKFWPAESVHQGYYRRNSVQPYCQVVIEPKLARFRKRFAAKRPAAS